MENLLPRSSNSPFEINLTLLACLATASETPSLQILATSCFMNNQIEKPSLEGLKLSSSDSSLSLIPSWTG